MKETKICFPEAGAKLPVQHGNGEFFAHGTAPDPTQVLGLMFNTKSKKCYIGNLLPYNPKTPKHWVVFFQVPKPKKTDKYALRIYTHSPCPADEPDAKVGKLKFAKGAFGVTNTYPQSGTVDNPTPCCSNPFSAQGGLSGQDTDIDMNTTVVTNSAGINFRVTSRMVLKASWYCEWQGLADDVYSMDVFGNGNPPGHVNVVFLDISAANC
jgi:hypothetical protein